MPAIDPFNLDYWYAGFFVDTNIITWVYDHWIRCFGRSDFLGMGLLLVIMCCVAQGLKIWRRKNDKKNSE